MLEQLSVLLPKDLATRKNLAYGEPFVGGGAMLFFMLGRYPNITRAVINDLNRELIATYRSVKESPDELIDILRKQQDRYRACTTEEERKAFYLAERERYNKRGLRDVEVAALFIFLLFNVPFGKSVNPLICDEDTIRADSKLLQKVEILNGDFEQVEKALGKNAFVYFDPPYRPLTQTASFTAYAKDGFNDDEQRRLAAFCRRLDKNGHQWLLSNSDPHNADPSDMFFEDIYSGFDINRVSASRMVNSDASGRGKIAELAIRNYRD